MRRIVAMYENLPDVEPVIRALVAAGVARDGITVIANTGEHRAFQQSRSAAQGGGMSADAAAGAGPDSRAGRGDEDFLGWLFGGGAPPPDATAYHRGVESGGKLISVDAADALHDRAVAILERHGAIDIDERGQRDEPAAAPGAGEGIAAGGTAPVQGGAGRPAAGAGSRRVRSYAVGGPAARPVGTAPDLTTAGNKPGAAIAGLAPEEIDGGANWSRRR